MSDRDRPTVHAPRTPGERPERGGDVAPSVGGLVAVNPEQLGAPRGYSNGMLAPPNSRLLFVAGQIGWDSGQELVSGGFAEQFGQALVNVVAVVRAAGGSAKDVARLTIYVTDIQAYIGSLPAVGEAYRGIMVIQSCNQASPSAAIPRVLAVCRMCSWAFRATLMPSSVAVFEQKTQNEKQTEHAKDKEDT